MSLLPQPVRTKLIAAASLPKHLRSKAIDQTYTWAQLHFPEYFRVDGDGSRPKNWTLAVPTLSTTKGKK